MKLRYLAGGLALTGLLTMYSACSIVNAWGPFNMYRDKTEEAEVLETEYGEWESSCSQDEKPIREVLSCAARTPEMWLKKKDAKGLRDEARKHLEDTVAAFNPF